MKVRQYENIFIFIELLFFFISTIILAIAFIDVNNLSSIILSKYFFYVTILFIIELLIYLLFLFLNKHYFVFENIGIYEIKQGKKKLLIKYSNILYSNYSSILKGIISGNGEFGVLTIYSKGIDIEIYISWKKIKKLWSVVKCQKCKQ